MYMRHIHQKFSLIFALVCILFAPVPTAYAVDESQPPGSAVETLNGATSNNGEEVIEQQTLLSLINKGGVVGYLIILISIVALGLAIDNFATTRRSRILPQADIDTLRQLIDDGEFDKITQMDGKHGSYVLQVTAAGIREIHMGYDNMIKAMEDTAEALASTIARRTEHLNVIGSISPMLGLLGTVIGMLQVFNEIAITPGAIEPRQLAEGIFQALVTTCLGLTVAIPALYAYAILRNRIDEFAGEAAVTAEHLVASFKPVKG